jgi:UDP-N-acetylglucosamine--N-acetylmuramyl-(pentapeptide) pyrophosphoryl-undecaprenol N-acetylglucosamine transferase
VTLRAARDAWPDPHRRRYQVVEFVGHELADVYAAADLVLGRAGAGTIAELAHFGLPSVLVPLPGAGGDEQTRNGRLLADAGGAILIQQADATPERLRDILVGLLDDGERRHSMAARARAVGRPDAAALLVDELLHLANAH